MKTLAALTTTLLILGGQAYAQTPSAPQTRAPAKAAAVDATGEWLVKDGSARIAIRPCSDDKERPAREREALKGAMCGVLSWTKFTPVGLDDKNPDPAKRTRSVMGMPIILDMKPSASKENRWEGQIYNSENGKTYDGSITLESADALRVEGCVLGILCGGETWTRHKAPATAAAPGAAAPRAPGPAPARTATPAAPAPAPAPTAR